MSISAINQALADLEDGIQNLQRENMRLREAVLKEKKEIREEFEEELNYLNDRLKRCWMDLSPLEDERLRKFRDKHYQLHKKDNGFIAHIFGTGIGTCYKIECPICHESEDITDVSNW